MFFSFVACQDKDADGCENRVKFDTEIKEYVSYLPDNIGLTATEQALTVPSFQYYSFDFCKTSNKNSKGSITNFVENTPLLDFPEDALGIEKNIKWKAEFSNSNLTISKNENDIVDALEVQKINEKMLSCLTMFNAQPLIQNADFENFIKNAKNEFEISKLANGDFKLIKYLSDGGRSETILSIEFQREVANALYDSQNELLSLHTWYYQKNGAAVTLLSEMFQSFTLSPDSKKTIVVNRFLRFKNVVIN